MIILILNVVYLKITCWFHTSKIFEIVSTISDSPSMILIWRISICYTFTATIKPCFIFCPIGVISLIELKISDDFALRSKMRRKAGIEGFLIKIQNFDFRFNTPFLSWIRVKKSFSRFGKTECAQSISRIKLALIGSFLKKISGRKNMKKLPNFWFFFYTPCNFF